MNRGGTARHRLLFRCLCFVDTSSYTSGVQAQVSNMWTDFFTSRQGKTGFFWVLYFCTYVLCYLGEGGRVRKVECHYITYVNSYFGWGCGLGRRFLSVEYSLKKGDWFACLV